MIDYFVFGLCILSLFGWNIYLMRQNQILINKLMSKNYGDYVISNSYESGTTEAEVESEVEVKDPYYEQKARELNSILGI